MEVLETYLQNFKAFLMIVKQKVVFFHFFH